MLETAPVSRGSSPPTPPVGMCMDRLVALLFRWVALPGLLLLLDKPLGPVGEVKDGIFLKYWVGGLALDRNDGVCPPVGVGVLFGGGDFSDCTLEKDSFDTESLSGAWRGSGIESSLPVPTARDGDAEPDRFSWRFFKFLDFLVVSRHGELLLIGSVYFLLLPATHVPSMWK